MPGFRLIFADPIVGQVVKTFKQRSFRVREVVGLLIKNDEYRFAEVCAARGVEPTALGTANGLIVRGLDGVRCAPVKNDDDLQAFYNSVRSSPIPSVEVELLAARGQPIKPQVGAPKTTPAVPPSGARPPQRGKDPRDRMEEIEDENAQMSASVARVARQLDALQRQIESVNENAEVLVKRLKDETIANQAKAVQDLQQQIDDCRVTDNNLYEDLVATKKHLKEVEKTDKEGYNELKEEIRLLDENTSDHFEDVAAQIQALKYKDQELEQEDQRQNGELLKHDAELARLEEVKVNIIDWEKKEAENLAELNRRFEESYAKIQSEVDDQNAQREALRQALEKADADMLQLHNETTKRIDADVKHLEEVLRKALEEGVEYLKKRIAELTEHTNTHVARLDDLIATGFRETKEDILARDATIHRKVDELSAKTEMTFNMLNDRMEAAFQKERARLGNLERDLAEGTAKLRSDFRAEMERMREDFEQDHARMQEDMGELHMKHDVTKQEINFFQSRLVDQKEQFQRLLTETSSATRAVQVDSQEGLAACQRMLHALRDDAVGFREKMAKYISVLQHASDQQGDAVSSLETHRASMKMDLDAIIEDHKAYTADMDDWADDVRRKVERLFRALEPCKAQWLISGAKWKLTDLRKPLALKSRSFALKGLREVQIELYPHGTNTSPDGKSLMRLLMPPGGRVRFECWLGRQSSGPLEYDGVSYNNFSFDLPFDQWMDHLREDGSLIIMFEVLADHGNDDESLCPQVDIQCA
eukprot:TRINITY_DN37521_c0_g1_i1.p1 TRINITY_DN37521_c0_g1~~TRINITY_DN37521_c0_g1_i1.p1  ORF type:complete len:796 (-),score=246.56 TRINITY_DN37521_c0_g1_i1:73-2361(-)